MNFVGASNYEVTGEIRAAQEVPISRNTFHRGTLWQVRSGHAQASPRRSEGAPLREGGGKRPPSTNRARVGAFARPARRLGDPGQERWRVIVFWILEWPNVVHVIHESRSEERR